LLVAVLVSVAGWHVAPAAAFSRPSPPAAVGAYRDGGELARDPALEDALRALASSTPPAPPAALAGHPDSLADAWAGLTTALIAGERETDEVRARVLHLSDELAGAGLGYFVDVEVAPNGIPVIAPYRVAKVTFVRAGDERIRVLDLRALVPRHSPRSWLGMKPSGTDDAIVLLDAIDVHVRNELMPVLRGRGFLLADDTWAGTGMGRAASAAATQAIRRELAVASGVNGIGDMEQLTARVTKLLVASVRHHEAQHGYEHGHDLAMPDLLAARVGPLRDGATVNVRAARARNELSAYLSQIASDMWLPQTTLWSLARHTFAVGRIHAPETIAAVIILEGLARRRGATIAHTSLEPLRVDRDRLAALVPELAELPSIELRTLAAELWEELFGTPLVRLVDDVFGV
jgi:hypothetical protein